MRKMQNGLIKQELKRIFQHDKHHVIYFTKIPEDT